MANRLNYVKDEVIIESSDYTTTTGTPAIILPSIAYNSGTGRYDALCCAITFGGNNYNMNPVGPVGDNNKYSFWAKDVTGVNDNMLVGTPSALANSEPTDLNVVTDMDFDGTSNVDIVIGNNGVTYVTLLCATGNRAALVAQLGILGYTPDLQIPSVFTFNGGGSDYTFVESAITSTAATLWGADGAGDERPVLNPFTAGDILFTENISDPTQLQGVAIAFKADGAQKNMVCYLKIDGVIAYPLPVVDDGKESIFGIIGRIVAPDGSVVTVEVAENNSGGGTVNTALLMS